MRGLGFLALALLVAACGCRDKARLSPADQALHDKIVGTWVLGNPGPSRSGGETTLMPDGTFICRATNRWANGSREFAYNGTWSVRSGSLLFTYTKTSEPTNVPMGSVDLSRILRLDEQNLILIWKPDQADAQTNVLRRRK